MLSSQNCQTLASVYKKISCFHKRHLHLCTQYYISLLSDTDEHCPVYLSTSESCVWRGVAGTNGKPHPDLLSQCQQCTKWSERLYNLHLRQTWYGECQFQWNGSTLSIKSSNSCLWNPSSQFEENICVRWREPSCAGGVFRFCCKFGSSSSLCQYYHMWISIPTQCLGLKVPWILMFFLFLQTWHDT